MKIKKVFFIFVAAIVLPILAYQGYDTLSSRERFAIRELCTQLKTGDKVDLNLLKRYKLKLFTYSFSPAFNPKIIREKFENTTEVKKDYDILSSGDFSEMFFLAEGFNRESLALSMESGVLTKVKCHTNTGFAEH